MGQGILLVVTTGAIGFHLRYGRAAEAMPAVIMWVLSAVALVG